MREGDSRFLVPTVPPFECIREASTGTSRDRFTGVPKPKTMTSTVLHWMGHRHSQRDHREGATNRNSWHSFFQAKFRVRSERSYKSCQD